MPIQKQSVVLMFSAVFFVWLQVGMSSSNCLAADEKAASETDAPRQILLYYGNRLVDLRKSPSESGADDHATAAVENGLRDAVSEQSNLQSSLPVNEKAGAPGNNAGHDVRERPSGNVLRQWVDVNESIGETADTKLSGPTKLPGLTNKLPLLIQESDFTPRANDVTAEREEVRPIAETSAPTFAEKAKASPTVAASEPPWREQRLTLLVAGLLGAVVCLALVVIQLLIASRRSVESFSPTVQLALPNFGNAFVSPTSTGGESPQDYQAQSCGDEPNRNGNVVDLAEQPVPFDLFAGSSEQQRLQDQAQKEQQEQAILTEIFNDNVRMREVMQAQIA